MTLVRQSQLAKLMLIRPPLTLVTTERPNLSFLTSLMGKQVKRFLILVDMWSVGCIMGELYLGGALFGGSDTLDLVHNILKVCGTPDQKTINGLASERAKKYIKTLPTYRQIPFKQIFTNAPPEAIDLLQKLLVVDPEARITVEGALAHKFLKALHDININDEPGYPHTLNASFEKIESADEIRSMFVLT